MEVEEAVYRFEPCQNGAGPLWCMGSTCLVRSGADVFASGMETLKDVKPLNNTRWTLWKREASGWELQQADPVGRSREPCPLVGFADGRLLLSANPTLNRDLEQRTGPARPEVLEFRAADPKAPFRRLVPQWEGSPAFSEHSYRTFAADGPAGELILFQNAGPAHMWWSLLAADGTWRAKGRLAWPWGAEYDKPQPIRVCYPCAVLSRRALHLFGVSDITEPYTRWREYKKKLTGRDWDYDFRRLFYVASDDVTTGRFHDWIEVASRDKTAGWTMPCDLAVDSRGVHLLWAERAIDVRLRKDFFPDAKQKYALGYARLEGGKVAVRTTLLEAEEGISGETPQWGRFHVTPAGRLFVFCYVDGRDARGKSLSENRLLELRPEGTIARSLRLPMKQPLARYFTATVRGGSPPSTTLDLLSTTPSEPLLLRYARIRLW